MSQTAQRDIGEGSSRYVEIDDDEGNESKDTNDNNTSSSNDQLSGSDGSRHSTRSVTQSQLEEHFENGRRYCSRTYYMPADDREQTRLAVVHQAYLAILDGNLTLAAIPRNAERILDIGTGNGDWAMAVAERFQGAEITATDLTSILQPTAAPENLFFELDDAQDEWAYSEPFDFIHVRGLIGAFEDWPRLYKQAAKNLKRGGILEVADMELNNLTVQPEESQLKVLNEAIQTAAGRAGTPLNLGHVSRPAFNDSGLNVIKTKSINVPLGTWTADPRKKVAGKMALIAALESVEATSLRLLTRYLDYSGDDVKALCQKAIDEVLQDGAKPSMAVNFVVARKIM